MDAKAEIWCDRDQRKRFEYYIDFNEWLDSEEAGRFHGRRSDSHERMLRLGAVVLCRKFTP